MILNIIILLSLNTFLPYIPIPPQVFLPLPLVQLYIQQPSVYQSMNLSRIHTKQQLKKSFKQSMKYLHPDRGGNVVQFSKVQNLRKIMEQQIDYYDTFNVTDADLQHSNINLSTVVRLKKTEYKVQAFLYYFIVLIYSLSDTMGSDMRPLRNRLLLAIIFIAILEIHCYIYPQRMTLIDLFNNKIPLFTQKMIFKTMLSVLIAIIRTKYKRKITKQQILLSNLKKEHTQDEYIQILTNLSVIYNDRVKQKQRNEKSWKTKWIKLLSLLFFYAIFKNVFGIKQNINL